ncbi:glycosyltransferase [Anaerovibrio lipolyticus]|uniref:glycosyltransferase n=1 Tax=Anaerovibrio lipolyticus TaxID=82374 RepID=UPI0025F4A6E6|nr:glycosyltransferase [Anaerovibrio lipolyticus]
MRFAIMESVVTPGGHEIDFDRILVEELSALGHTVEFYVPEGHEFKWHYGVPVHHISGTGVSYRGAHGVKKILLSAKREWHRQKWYKAMYEYAKQGAFDAIIFPSATYRYLRALQHNPLQNSMVPVLFLIHGATPNEAERLNEMVKKFDNRPNIRIGVQTFAKNKLHLTAKYLSVYGPPNYIPRDIEYVPHFPADDEILTIGFFGQYRREKNLETFLEAFLSGEYKRRVKLFIQGATQTAEDAADFERIINKYKAHESMEFLHKPLIGIDWQKAIASVDAVAIPYGNDRYLYHTSALISNAMGYQKPIIAADNVNPEILKEYNIGRAFKNNDMEDLRRTLELFINGYGENRSKYASELTRAYNDYSPQNLARNIVSLADETYDNV